MRIRQNETVEQWDARRTRFGSVVVLLQMAGSIASAIYLPKWEAALASLLIGLVAFMFVKDL